MRSRVYHNRFYAKKYFSFLILSHLNPNSHLAKNAGLGPKLNIKNADVKAAYRKGDGWLSREKSG
jgi:hypothetical protein